MNWILTIQNKSGLVSKVGYTDKSRDQIEAIKNRWIDEGLKVLRISKRAGA